MFSPEANGTGVANPAEIISSVVRLAELPITKPNTLWELAYWLYAAGQDIASPPNVFGYPNCGLVRGGQVQDGSAWIQGPQTYITIGNAISSILWRVNIPAASQGEGVNLIDYFSPPSITTPAALVDRVAGILQIELNPDQRNILIAYLGKNNAGAPSPWNRNQLDRLSGLIRLMVMSVEFLKK